jgi:cytochrome oxidase Cu insertion factor (SCO1/SenC/PrrC family)
MTQTENTPQTEFDSSQLWRNRITLLTIVGVFVLPFFILPLIMSPEDQPKTNKGEFVMPHVPLDQLELATVGQQVFDDSEISGRWLLLYFIPASCEQACINSLYAIRQVKKALDRDVDRARQLLVHTTAPSRELQDLLSKEFDTMLQANGDASKIDSVMVPSMPAVGQPSRAGMTYLVSPDGYIFIYYPPYEDEQESILHARDIRKDLRKSMKGSIEG